MDLLPPNQTDPGITSQSAQEDEFASGSQTRLRRWFAQRGAKLFAPPYLPSSLAGYLFLSLLLFLVIQLGQQPPEYWIDQSNPIGLDLFIGLLNINVWIYLAAGLAFSLVVILLLSLLHWRAAFLSWFALSILTFSWLASVNQCGYRPFFFTKDQNICQWTAINAYVLFGLIWGLALAGALEQVKRIQKPSIDSLSPGAARQPVILLRISMALLLGLLLMDGAGLGKAIAAPRPQWKKLNTQALPKRDGFSLAYDTHRQRAVFFGGSNSWTSNLEWIGENDTWEWDGENWAIINTLVSPPPRLLAGMAYDEKRGVTVLFGGENLNVAYADTWEWDGQRWTEHTQPNGPGPRSRFQMTYDPLREKVVLYGGYAHKKTTDAACDTWYQEAWAWDGAVWEKILMQPDPKLCCYTLVFSPFQNALLLFNSQGLRIWSGNQFIPSKLSEVPQGRDFSTLVYEPQHQVMVSFGGNIDDISAGDTWQYDGKAWKQIYTAEKPPARTGHGMFYDTTRGRVLLVGGKDKDTFYNDTWELTLP